MLSDLNIKDVLLCKPDKQKL